MRNRTVSRRSVLRSALAIAAALACVLPASADPGVMLGAGNVHSPDRQLETKFRILHTVGLRMCRIPLDGKAYWKDGAAHPEVADAAVLEAMRNDVDPLLLLEYYTRWHGEIGDYDKWRAIGKALAERFAPGSEFLKSQGVPAGRGVTHYTAINEPMWRSNNPTPIDPNQYAKALEGLADGVHSVSAKLHVSPGGYQEVPLFANKNPYIKAVAGLYNAGKLHAIDIHRYWDVQYVPMDKGRQFSLQAQFDQARKQAGITTAVKFQTTETNFKKRLVTEDQAASGLLTGLWDALTVVGDDGKPVTQFVMPWNVFNTTEKDTNYGLCVKQAPWEPTARGKVLMAVAALTRGMEIVSCDPRKTGVTVLAGAGRKMWVWQNRKGWTDRPGVSFEVTDIPAGAKNIEVHAWDGLRRKIDSPGQSRIVVTGLEPNQTYMFLAVP